MPKAFEKCVKEGGRVRTLKLKGNKYRHICYPKGGGKGILGEVKTKETNSPVGRVYKGKGKKG